MDHAAQAAQQNIAPRPYYGPQPPQPDAPRVQERITQVLEMTMGHLEVAVHVLDSIEGNGSIAGQTKPLQEPSPTLNTLAAQAVHLRNAAIMLRERLERLASSI